MATTRFTDDGHILTQVQPDSRVTCSRCKARVGKWLVDVGNSKAPEMGHAAYFMASKKGAEWRYISACAATVHEDSSVPFAEAEQS
jgi:hypothetical protein